MLYFKHVRKAKDKDILKKWIENFFFSGFPIPRK